MGSSYSSNLDIFFSNIYFIVVIFLWKGEYWKGEYNNVCIVKKKKDLRDVPLRNGSRILWDVLKSQKSGEV